MPGCTVTNDLSASDVSEVQDHGRVDALVGANASAASRVQPPARIASRRMTARSASVRRSTLSRSQRASSVSAQAPSGRRPQGHETVRPRVVQDARGERVVMRAAASSIANGIPSRRRQILAIAEAFSSESRKLVVDRLCALYKQFHRRRLRNLGHRRRFVRVRQRRHPVDSSPGRVQRFAAGRKDAHVRARTQDRGDQVASIGKHVLTVVENDQDTIPT